MLCDIIEVIGIVAISVIALFIVYVVAWTFVMAYRKRKYGCNRCEYGKIVYIHGHARFHCTASCGNDVGNTCPAWRYQDPANRTRLYYPPEGMRI